MVTDDDLFDAFDAGAARFVDALERIAGAKYHATITWASLARIHERMHLTPCATSAERIARHPDLLGAALATRDDLAALRSSPVARAVFVLP
jgi:hypothetical protein